MAKNLASLTLMLGANIKGFQTAMRQASNELKKTGKQMQSIGKSMSMYVTAPILAMGAVSVMSFDKQAKAIAQVEAGLKSTGGTVGYTSKELQKMASELQNISLFGDEEILQGVTSQLLTFTNITNEQFARTQVAAMDLATRLDGDLKSASIQLGKALNDPVANLSALSRSGIQFSKEQKEVINALVATNRLADAQTIILDELERQYGGSAKAAAEAGAGPLTQLKNIIGDLSEEFGKIIMEYIKPFIAKLKEWTLAFKDLNPNIKATILVIAGITAAIGPALIIIGKMSVGIAALATMKFPLLISMFAKLKVAAVSLFTVISANPIGALITVIGLAAGALLLFANRSVETKKKLHELGTEIEGINEKIGAQIYTQLVSGFEKLSDGSYAAIGSVKKLGAAVSSMTKGELDSLEAFLNNEIKNALRAAANATDNLSKSVIETNLKEYRESLKLVSNELGKYATKSKDVVIVNDEIADSAERAAVEMEKLSSKKTPAPEATQLPQHSFNLPATLKGMDAFKANYVARWGQTVDTLNQITNASIADFGLSIGEAIGNMLSGEKINFGATVLESVGNFLKEMGKALIIYGGLMEAFKSAFSNPFVAIAAGVAAIAAGTVLMNLAKRGPEQMASGGIVPAGFPGDTYPALLTSGERVIPAAIPLPSDGGGAQDITVRLIGKLSGSDILLSSERAQVNRTRTRGY